jgi:hypothetical protein
VYRAGQSPMEPYRERMLMKSKGREYVHGSVMSSISNLQLGGVKEGWMGERSMPVISAVGCSRWGN